MKLYLPALVIAALSPYPVAHSWSFEIFDENCVTSTDLETGTGDVTCATTANPHECFKISNMGNCMLFLHASVAACDDDLAQQDYDAGEEDVDISPQFAWDSWSMLC